LTVTRETRMIDKVTKVVNLYDLYGTLLTQRQRELVEMYYFDDWSLAEIAENLGVSRQAVHDNLRRAEEQLDSYERALGLLESQAAYAANAREVLALWQSLRDWVPEPSRGQFEAALERLTNVDGSGERGDDRA
jgi:predicted DNA-binding protein YlxM (UPF0122 family)